MWRWSRRSGILLVLCAVSGAGATWALPKTEPKPAAREGFAGRGALGLNVLLLPAPLEAKLRLTVEQKARWTELRQAVQRSSRTAVRPGTLVDPAGGFVQAQAAQRKAEDDALALLVPEQRKAWEVIKRDAFLYGGLGRAGLGLLTVDGIGPAQKAQLKELLPQVQARRQELQRPEPRGITRQQIAERVRGFDTELEGIVRRMLTSEQAIQFDAALPLLPYPGT